MAKNKEFQNKNTVSGNKAETNATNCGKSQNSAKNRTSNSNRYTTDKAEEKNMDTEDKY